MNIQKITILTLAILATLSVKAQDLPNGGFENWNYFKGSNFETPTGWVTNDILTAKINPKYMGNSTGKSSETHSGNYAVKMQVVIDHGDTANGCIYSTTSIDSIILLDQGLANTGFKYSQHATSFTGFYKFNAVAGSGDSAFFGVTLTKWNKQTGKRDILINTIFLVGQNALQYAPFVVPLRYQIKGEDPDTALIVIGIQGPHAESAHTGTNLFIDDIGFSVGVPPAKKE